jgi:hypothetical protein
MTARELAALIGTHVYLEPSPGLRFECVVVNAKTSYGVRKVEIAPIAGHGRAWVNLASTRPTQPEGEAHGR